MPRTASVPADLDVLAALDRTASFALRDEAHNGFNKLVLAQPFPQLLS